MQVVHYQLLPFPYFVHTSGIEPCMNADEEKLNTCILF